MNEQLLEELEKMISDVFEMPDQDLENAKEEFLSVLVDAYTGVSALDMMDDYLRKADMTGRGRQDVLNDVNNSKVVLAEVFEKLKETYADSQLRLELLDNIGSVIENFLNMIIMRMSSRATANIAIEKVHSNAKLPTYAHEGDQGADIYAPEDFTLPPHSYGNMISTGLKMIIPEGWAVAIRPRSGLSKNTTLRISNVPATIDSKFRGEINILLDNIGDEPIEIKAGDRIAQFILEKNYQASFVEIDEVPTDTERGIGGFGSSGK